MSSGSARGSSRAPAWRRCSPSADSWTRSTAPRSDRSRRVSSPPRRARRSAPARRRGRGRTAGTDCVLVRGDRGHTRHSRARGARSPSRDFPEGCSASRCPAGIRRESGRRDTDAGRRAESSARRTSACRRRPCRARAGRARRRTTSNSSRRCRAQVPSLRRAVLQAASPPTPACRPQRLRTHASSTSSLRRLRGAVSLQLLNRIRRSWRRRKQLDPARSHLHVGCVGATRRGSGRLVSDERGPRYSRRRTHLPCAALALRSTGEPTEQICGTPPCARHRVTQEGALGAVRGDVSCSAGVSVSVFVQTVNTLVSPGFRSLTSVPGSTGEVSAAVDDERAPPFFQHLPSNQIRGMRVANVHPLRQIVCGSNGAPVDRRIAQHK